MKPLENFNTLCQGSILFSGKNWLGILWLWSWFTFAFGLTWSLTLGCDCNSRWALGLWQRLGIVGTCQMSIE
jgi:hypothetical protein